MIRCRTQDMINLIPVPNYEGYYFTLDKRMFNEFHEIIENNSYGKHHGSFTIYPNKQKIRLIIDTLIIDYMNNNINEIWKNIENNRYAISNLGRLKVYTKTHHYYASGVLDKNGYIRYSMYKDGKKRNVFAHRLVAINFITNNQNKEQVNHLNGIKTDNRVENLEWSSASENITHAFKIGLKTQQGSHNNGSKLTEDNIHEIRKMLKENFTHKQIAKKFGLHHLYIGLIKSKRRWGWLEEKDV